MIRLKRSQNDGFFRGGKIKNLAISGDFWFNPCQQLVRVER